MKSSSSGQILFEIIIASLIIISVGLAITQVITFSVRGVDTTMSQTPGVFFSPGNS